MAHLPGGDPNPLTSEGEGWGPLPTPFNWFPPTRPVLLTYQPCCFATWLICRYQGGEGIVGWREVSGWERRYATDWQYGATPPARPFDGAQGGRPRPWGWIPALGDRNDRVKGVGGVGGGLLLGHGTKTSWDFLLTSDAFDRKTAASNLPAVSCWNDVPFPPQKK